MLEKVEDEATGSDSEVDKVQGGETHNLNHVGMAFWTLQTMLISQPLVGTSMTVDEFTLLSALIGHLLVCESSEGSPLSERVLR